VTSPITILSPHICIEGGVRTPLLLGCRAIRKLQQALGAAEFSRRCQGSRPSVTEMVTGLLGEVSMPARVHLIVRSDVEPPT